MSASTSTSANQAPIVYFLGLLLQTLSFTFTALASLTRVLAGATRFIFTPVFVASAPVLYLLAPVIVFINIVAETFILTPYRITLYLLDALYPMYVLVGTACICAGLVAIGARLVIYATKKALLKPGHAKSQAAGVTYIESSQSVASLSGAGQRRVTKRVSIKEEKRPERIPR